jgi:PAS domain S-box-containing protein
VRARFRTLTPVIGQAIRQSAWAILLVVLLASSAEAAPRHVVLLQSSERGNLVLDRFTAILRMRLGELSTEPLTLTEFVVTPAGLSDFPELTMVEFLRSALAGARKPDLVITTGGAAAALVQRHRAQLFPDSPILYSALDQRWDGGVTDRETAVKVALDPAGTVEEIVRLLPATENVFVVVGGGPLGRFWRTVLDQESSQFRGRLRFIWPDGMSYAAMLQRASSLPAGSVVFFTSTFEVDGNGSTNATERVLADLRARANAPIFGMLSPELGHGLIGGKLIDIDALSRTTADIAFRILGGTSPALIKSPVQQPGPPVFDWRELQRWGISEDRLPAGSRVLFREPSMWERYKWPIVSGVAALVAQSLLITGLLVNRVKRQRAEQLMRESEGRFRVLANSAPVMIRMSDVDALTTDFNVPWLAFTGRDIAAERGNGWLDGVHPDDVPNVSETGRKAFERREPYRMEYRLRRADGEYRWLLDTGQPRTTPDGAFAGTIGSAIDITDLKMARATLSNLNGRLIEAQELERSRLARELHDDVGQQITMLALDVERLGQTIPQTEVDARQQARHLRDEVTTLASHVSGISHRLHSSRLDLFGLAAAAETFCKEVSSRGVVVEFTSDNVPTTLRPDIAINLFRVLQEALSNAVKHSGGSRCDVSLRGTNDQLELAVRDEGRGFDTDAALATPGLGLVSMQERLKLVNGCVAIESRPGAGTTVRATVSLSRVRADS